MITLLVEENEAELIVELLERMKKQERSNMNIALEVRGIPVGGMKESIERIEKLKRDIEAQLLAVRLKPYLGV